MASQTSSSLVAQVDLSPHTLTSFNFAPTPEQDNETIIGGLLNRIKSTFHANPMPQAQSPFPLSINSSSTATLDTTKSTSVASTTTSSRPTLPSERSQTSWTVHTAANIDIQSSNVVVPLDPSRKNDDPSQISTQQQQLPVTVGSDKSKKTEGFAIKAVPPSVSLTPAFTQTPSIEKIDPIATIGGEAAGIQSVPSRNHEMNSRRPSLELNSTHTSSPLIGLPLTSIKVSSGKTTTSSIPFPSVIKERLIDPEVVSIQSTSSMRQHHSVTRAIRRLRGEGLSKEYWMADENCKECYDCRSPFTAFRRKHHCRICGQIFCNNCTSNVVSGERFNHPGLMRVCNLCFQIMEEYDDFDEDPQDLYSVPPSHVNSDMHQRTLSLMSGSAVDYASFGRSPSPSDPNFALDGRFRKMFSAGTSLFRPRTRSNTITDEHAHMAILAPFRRHVNEEVDRSNTNRDDAVIDPELARFMSDDEDDREASANNLMSFASLMISSMSHGKRGIEEEEEPIDDRGRLGKRISTKKRAQTPDFRSLLDPTGRERRKSLQSLIRPSRMKTGGNVIRQYNISHGDNGVEVVTPTIATTLNVPLISQSGRSQSWHQHVELNNASLQHVRALLGQSLRDAGIPNVEEWTNTMMKLLLQISDNLYPNIRAGDEIDIRHYVKIKKIPGGLPSDSEYVQGVVCTKNLSHKQMARSLINPRIMVLTFPLEYQRVENQFMSLEPVMAQEREYLKRLVARIVDQRPHIVLVERSVSRLALEYLLKAHVTVARNVKASVIEAVARCTQADVIPSLDKLAWEARLGRCGRFTVRTYEHDLIPGRRKTYMYFDQCQRELGCTIVLRGANFETLEKLKQITDLMAFVVYNLKMETFLLRDEFAMVPSQTVTSADETTVMKLQPSSLPKPGDDPADVDPEDEDLSTRIIDAIKPYENAILSASPFVKFPAPYPLIRMQRNYQQLKELMAEREIYMAKRKQEMTSTDFESTEILDSAARSGEITDVTSVMSDTGLSRRGPTDQCLNAGEPEKERPINPLNTMSRTSSIPPSSLRLHVSAIMQEEPLEKERNDNDTDNNVVNLMALVANDKKTYSADQNEIKEKSSLLGDEEDDTELPFGIPKIEEIIKSSEEIKQDSDFYLAKKEHALQVRAWQSYISQSTDDISPFAHQNIAVLYSTVSLETGAPCQGPEIQIIEYYRESDRTLGQYIEEMCFSASFICGAKGCDKPMLLHCRSYVHGEARITVHMEAFPTPLPGMENSILMWSYCKVCKKSTPVIPMSEETWKYSFGKYVELSFYNNDVSCRADICPHNIHREHIRYFGLKDLAMRFEYEPIQLLEVIVPSMKLIQKPAILMRLKNKDLATIQEKIQHFWDSVAVRIRNFHYEVVSNEKVEECRKDMVQLNKKVEAERREMLQLLQDTYVKSKPTDTLALNVVRRVIQERVVQWDNEFAEIEKKYLPIEKDIRRMTASQIMRMFVDKDSSDKGTTNAGAQSLMADNANEMLSGGEEKVETAEEKVNSKSKIEVSTPVSRNETMSINASTETDHSESGSEAVRSGPESAGKRNLPQPLSLINSERESGHDTDAATMNVRHFPANGSKIPKAASKKSSADESLAKSSRDSPMESRRSSVDTKSIRGRPKTRIGVPSKGGNKSEVSDVEGKLSLLKTSESARTANISVPSSASQQRQAGAQPSGRRLPSFSSRDIVLSGGEGGSSERTTTRGYAAKTASSKRREADRSSSNVKERPSISRSSTKNRVPSLATSGRVSTLARHYDRLSKEIERQQRLSFVRGRRARPVATTKPIVEVFKNLKDAVRDESDEEEQVNDHGDADDEFEADEYVKRRTMKGKLLKSESRKIPHEGSMESYVFDPMAKQKHPRSEVSTASTIGVRDQTAQLLNEAAAKLSESIAEGKLEAVLPVESAVAEQIDATIQPLRHGSVSESEYSAAGVERSSLIKTISNLWSDRSVADFMPLEYPLLPNEHVFADSKVIVREDEPGSIIAFTLSSKDYLGKLAAMQIAASPMRELAIEKAKSYFDRHAISNMSIGTASLAPGNASFKSTGDAASIDVDNEDTMQGVAGTHLKYQFQEGSAKLFCKIFFAEEFDAIRRHCGCDETYIESLARCVKWDSTGGKSGSAFLKTRDDRLIMKELSRPEMHALLKFAPAYFEYMNQAFFTAMPTTLAKIFGFYRIGYKNPATGKSMRMDVIVMENLFYERKGLRIFDLKGSMRNRHVQSTGRENEVLLDENLIEFMQQSPLFIREHSKRLLRASLWNDTLFLAKLNVMDYSLVVGIDEKRHELVVGIIDIIRTFTWDKKLESWVKETAFLGGGGRGEPTIITPRQYKNRFREAMERYFMLVPDVWVSADSIQPPKKLKGVTAVAPASLSGVMDSGGSRRDMSKKKETETSLM